MSRLAIGFVCCLATYYFCYHVIRIICMVTFGNSFFDTVMDTIFSIFRRLFKEFSGNKPDLLHFHQLIMRVYREIISRKKISRLISNPLATAIILPFACLPVIFGIKFSHNVLVGLLVVIISTFFYLLF